MTDIEEQEYYYKTNKDWYYFDIRSSRDKLTDKATPKALDSYFDYMLYLAKFRHNLTPEHIKELIEKDLKDYVKNKSRYSFVLRNGEYWLEKIDGKELDPAKVMFREE